MTVSQTRLCEIRDEDDRSQEARDFVDAVLAVCRERGFAIGHEDSHGGFQVYQFNRPEQLEANLAWFAAADEVRWLKQPDPPEPPLDPFRHDARDPFL